jgi:hypothetical protein
MNNKRIILAASVILGTLLLSSCTQKVENKPALETPIEVKEVKQEKEFSFYNYVPYSESDIKKSDKLNILFFNSPDSESIKELKTNLSKSFIHDGLVMYEIDFATNTELTSKYGVTEPHTFVHVDNDGNAIRKWAGSMTIVEMHTALTTDDTKVDATK